MSIRRFRPVFLVFTALLSFGKFAQAYTFTRIADDTGQVRSFSVPAINDAGIVVFRGIFNSGGTGGGIFSSNASGAINIVADNTGQFSGFGAAPTINESGAVAFLASTDLGDDGIFVNDGGIYATIVDNSGPYNMNNAPTPNINDVGNVLALPNIDGGGNALLTGSGGGSTTTIVSTIGPYGTPFGAGSPPSADGEVVFSASLDAGGEGLFRGAGGAITTILDTSGDFSSFSSPSFNAAEIVAFTALLDTDVRGVFTTDFSSGSIVTIADSSGDFEDFSAVSINSDGEIAFRATLDTGVDGIFTGPDAVADKVIQVGDALFDSTLASFTFRAAGFNDQGDITFLYTLENGIRGIAVASVSLDGDYNSDGAVDAADYTVWRNNVGAPAGTLPNDIDGGTIGSAQYDTWKANFCSHAGGQGARASESVPEPATVYFLLLAAGLMTGTARLRRPRRTLGVAPWYKGFSR